MHQYRSAWLALAIEDFVQLFSFLLLLDTDCWQSLMALRPLEIQARAVLGVGVSSAPRNISQSIHRPIYLQHVL